MKKFVLLIAVCLFNYCCFAQKEQSPLFIHNYGAKPQVFVDSVLTEFEYFNRESHLISNLKVVQTPFDSLTNSKNKVFITSKTPGTYNLLSYNYLKNKYFANTPKPILLFINSQIVTNYKSINIDSAYIYKIEVESGDDYNELKNVYAKYYIVNIKTKTHINLKNERLINMQGLPKGIEPE